MTHPPYAQPVSEPPGQWLERWLTEAAASGQRNHTAMALSTLDAEGAPRTRFVLCKGVSEHGVRFFTNLQSDKGLQIARDARVSVAFYWSILDRQVRLSGRLTQISDAQADAYFQSRHRLSQLGAWASEQSRPVQNRQQLDTAFDSLAERYPDVVPRPPHWSGFDLHAERWEFWSAKPGRMHERWTVQRGPQGWTQWLLQP